MKSRVVIVGSAVLNNHVLPTVAGFLTYIKGLKPKNRFAATFGSYGWATVGFKELEDSLSEAGMKMFWEGTYVQYVPDDADFGRLQATVELVKKALAGSVKSKMISTETLTTETRKSRDTE